MKKYSTVTSRQDTIPESKGSLCSRIYNKPSKQDVPCILIVDDDPMVAEVVKEMLSKTYRVQIAVSGKEGLEKLENNDISLIISDIKMPQMDGVMFYKNVLKSNPMLATKFIFFTGAPDPVDLEYFETNGLTYLIKPASVTMIYDKVSEMLDVVH